MCFCVSLPEILDLAVENLTCSVPDIVEMRGQWLKAWHVFTCAVPPPQIRVEYSF